MPLQPVAPSSGKYDGDLEQLTVAATAGGGRRRGMEQGVEVSSSTTLALHFRGGIWHLHSSGPLIWKTFIRCSHFVFLNVLCH